MMNILCFTLLEIFDLVAFFTGHAVYSHDLINALGRQTTVFVCGFAHANYKCLVTHHLTLTGCSVSYACHLMIFYAQSEVYN